MALSVSHCMGAQVSVSNIDRSHKRSCGRRYSGHLWFCRLRSCGTERAVGSCTFGCDDSTEGIDFRIVGTAQGPDIDANVSSVSAFEKETVLGQPFLGQRLLCRHHWIGCGHDTQVCPLSGEKGTAVGTASNSRITNRTAAQLTRPAPSGGRALSPMGDFSKPHP